MTVVFPTRQQRRAGGDRERLPGSRTPFKAAKMTIRQIEQAMKLPEGAIASALANIKPPRSRGHGAGKAFQRMVTSRTMQDRSKKYGK